MLNIILFLYSSHQAQTFAKVSLSKTVFKNIDKDETVVMFGSTIHTPLIAMSENIAFLLQLHNLMPNLLLLDNDG